MDALGRMSIDDLLNSVDMDVFQKPLLRGLSDLFTGNGNNSSMDECIRLCRMALENSVRKTSPSRPMESTDIVNFYLQSNFLMDRYEFFRCLCLRKYNDLLALLKKEKEKSGR